MRQRDGSPGGFTTGQQHSERGKRSFCVWLANGAWSKQAFPGAYNSFMTSQLASLTTHHHCSALVAVTRRTSVATGFHHPYPYSGIALIFDIISGGAITSLLSYPSSNSSLLSIPHPVPHPVPHLKIKLWAAPGVLESRPSICSPAPVIFYPLGLSTP